MPSSIIFTFLDVSLAILGLYLVKRHFDKPAGRRIPGPKGLPLIGNLFDVPIENEPLVFTEWQKKYGDIASATVLGQKIIILNSPKLAVDILTKKSSIYSNRPHFTMASDLVGWKDAIVMLPNEDRFRGYRKMMHQAIGSRGAVEKYLDTMESEAHACLRSILKDPRNPVVPVRKAVGAVILIISHGYKVTSANDPLVRVADAATDQLGILLAPGNFLVDTIPALQYVPEWVPGAGFQKIAREWRATLYELTDKSFDYVKQQMAAGTSVPNLVSNLMDGKKVSLKEEEDIKWAASSLYSAGIDNPVNALATFFLAMTMHPEVQRKAQAEIDAVIGRDRLPLFSDRDQMPYMNALCKELIRWGPTAPLGAPHCATQDDFHDGYFIPKGTIMVANIWHFLHDPEVYPDPNRFNPDRLISSPGKPAQRDPFEVSFGYGRRSCPGSVLADYLLFIFCASILAVYDIEKVEENGVIQEPKHEFTSGVLVKPKPFKTCLKPRSAKAEALIRSIEELR